MCRFILLFRHIVGASTCTTPTCEGLKINKKIAGNQQSKNAHHTCTRFQGQKSVPIFVNIYLNVSWVANITCLLDKQSKSKRTQLFPPCFYEIVARLSQGKTCLIIWSKMSRYQTINEEGGKKTISMLMAPNSLLVDGKTWFTKTVSI